MSTKTQRILGVDEAEFLEDICELMAKREESDLRRHGKEFSPFWIEAETVEIRARQEYEALPLSSTGVYMGRPFTARLTMYNHMNGHASYLVTALDDAHEARVRDSQR